MSVVAHRGGCHCGRVRFEVEAAREMEVHECNCSICSKVGVRLMMQHAMRRPRS